MVSAPRLLGRTTQQPLERRLAGRPGRAAHRTDPRPLDHHLRPLFWVAVVSAIGSVFLVAAVRESRAVPPTVPTRETKPKAACRSLPGGYWRVLAVLTTFNLVNFPDALLLLRAHDLGLSTALVVAAYAVHNCRRLRGA
ncbi:hypothetical protein AB0N14_02095 [Streptomyces sp. NPDC051104]|uniref:hypothetical protein n=1 Tax=Streptomyces sp. NPDC051104 TaxID=3155044 RepID=UPI0034278862